MDRSMYGIVGYAVHNTSRDGRSLNKIRSTRFRSPFSLVPTYSTRIPTHVSLTFLIVTLLQLVMSRMAGRGRQACGQKTSPDPSILPPPDTTRLCTRLKRRRGGADGEKAMHRDGCWV